MVFVDTVEPLANRFLQVADVAAVRLRIRHLTSQAILQGVVAFLQFVRGQMHLVVKKMRLALHALAGLADRLAEPLEPRVQILAFHAVLPFGIQTVSNSVSELDVLRAPFGQGQAPVGNAPTVAEEHFLVGELVGIGQTTHSQLLNVAAEP